MQDSSIEFGESVFQMPSGVYQIARSIEWSVPLLLNPEVLRQLGLPVVDDGDVSVADNRYTIQLEEMRRYWPGYAFGFHLKETNTAPVTININGIGDVPLVKGNAARYEAGELQRGSFVVVVYCRIIPSMPAGFWLEDRPSPTVYDGFLCIREDDVADARRVTIGSGHRPRVSNTARIDGRKEAAPRDDLDDLLAEVAGRQTSD